MRNRLRPATCAAAALVVALTATAGLAQSNARRTADGKPDFNGVWQVLNTANWDLQEHPARAGQALALGATGAVPAGLSVVEGDEIPYLPAAAAKKKENFENRLTADPEVKCYLPGVPRATYTPYPFQIVQSPEAILIAYEYAGAVRTIYMKNPPPSPADSWMGHSVGHWEGDTLVIDTIGLNDLTWLDHAGHVHSDALHLVERLQRVDHDSLMLNITFDDPKTFTKSFSSRRRFQLKPNMELEEDTLCEDRIIGHPIPLR